MTECPIAMAIPSAMTNWYSGKRMIPAVMNIGLRMPGSQRTSNRMRSP